MFLHFEDVWFLFAFLFFCLFVLCAHLNLIYFLVSFQQSHPAFHCLRSLGLASSLGCAVEPSSNVHWIGHRRPTLRWVESQRRVCILLCLKPRLHCWPKCFLSYGAHQVGLSQLCVGKLEFFIRLFFFLMDKSNLYCHFLSPKSAVGPAPPNPTEWLQFFSQVPASSPPGWIPLPYPPPSPLAATLHSPHFSYLLCTHGN